MHTLRSPTQTRDIFDRGFTLVEVVVAMMVFLIVSVLVAFSLTLSLSLTRSNRATEVAANLAAQQIDVARSAKNVFSVSGGTFTQTLDGITYRVAKTVGWVTSTGAVSDCGGASGILQDKTLNVSVSWSGMRAGLNPVQASTLLAPAGPINDPASGTVIVHVTSATGAEVAGVPIGIAPDSAISPNTATTVSPAPSATDSNGCSFVLKVVPGSYVITIGKSGDGMISNKQVRAPVFQVPVTAGQSSVIDDVQYDSPAQPVLTLSPGAPVGTLFPTALPMTYAPQGDAYSTSVTPKTAIVSGVTATTASASVFPFASGYHVFAGAYVSLSAPAGSGQPVCLSVDPGSWTSPNTAGNVGQRQAAVPVDPGSTGAVPMPTVTVAGVLGKYLVAVSATADASIGDPGCATRMTLAFPVSVGTSATLALPYGSWNLYALGSQNQTLSSGLVVPSTSITLPAGSPAFSAGNVFTLDPRQP